MFPFVDVVLLIPPLRAVLLQQKFDPVNQRQEAGRYVACYSPDASWRELSVGLYRLGEFKAVQLAKPHLQTVRGNCELLFSYHTHHNTHTISQLVLEYTYPSVIYTS